MNTTEKELRARLHGGNHTADTCAPEEKTNIRRSRPPSGMEHLTIQQLTSLRDRETNGRVRDRYDQEIDQRLVDGWDVTLGQVVREWVSKAPPPTPTKITIPVVEEPESVILMPDESILPEPDVFTHVTPLSQQIKEIEAGSRLFGLLFYEILASGWDYISPPNCVPFTNPPDKVEGFLETHKDDGFTYDYLSDRQQGFAIKIMKTYESWKRYKSKAPF